jgi:biotin carboxylase
MLLGAGRDQVPLIRKAREMGFRTVVISRGGQYPGFDLADKAYAIDVRSKERVLEVARQERIDAVVTDQTDISVPTVAYVAEQMGLPGIGYECALRFTNKYLMRQCCQRIGIPVPRYECAASLRVALKAGRTLGFPLVVKPVDSSGSRGVARINDARALEAACARAWEHSSRGEIILEQFVTGREIVVEALVSDFEVTTLVVGDRSYFDLQDVFVPKQTLFPSLLVSDVRQRLLAMNTELIRGLGPRFGISHTEWLINETSGDIHLVETAIRGGAVFITSDLVPLATGIDVQKVLLRLASGQNHVDFDARTMHGHACGYVCFSLPEGTITRVEGVEQVAAVPGVVKAFLSRLDVGRRTKPMKDKQDRLGPILIAGPDRRALEQTICQLRQTLVVEVETADGTRGIQW